MDELIVLRHVGKSRLAKLIKGKPGSFDVEGYDDAAKFTWKARPIHGVESIAMELEALAGDFSACVIRGAIKDGSRHKSEVNRRQHVGKDGIAGDWDHHAPGRRWVAFDVDKLPLPPELQPAGERPTRAEVAAIAAFARDSMLDEFRPAACAYRLSASAGLHGWADISMHLWFWLDRPVYDLSWRQWAIGRVDPSFFKAVQPHYTADPIFADIRDPLFGLRVGMLDGEAEVHPAPDLLDYSGWLSQENNRQRAMREDVEKRREAIIGALPQSDSATRAYALRALAGAIHDIMTAPVGNRHGTLVTKAHKLGGYIQPGFLDEFDIMTALEPAIEATFDSSRHAKEIQSAREMIETGRQKPLDLAHIGRPAPQRRPEPPDMGEPPEPPTRGRKPRLSVVRNDEAPTEGNAALKPAPKDPEAEKERMVEEMRARKVSMGFMPDFPDYGPKSKVLSTTDNLRALLEWMRVRVRRNLMNHETEWIAEHTDSVPRECLNSVMDARIYDEAAKLGWSVKENFFLRAIAAIESENAYHPVAEWARSRPWDGRSRFRELFRTLGFQPQFAEFVDLFEAQLTAWLVAGGRCLRLDQAASEGVEVQGVLVLQGSQDLGKTRWMKALLPVPEWCIAGVQIEPGNKDSIMRATSTFLAELGELDATTKKADVAALKAFLTSSKDSYRPPYGRKTETFARRTIYGATVNPDEFLRDPTGNRRYWTMPVESIEMPTAIDLQQLWAEAMVRSEAEKWWLPEDLKKKQAILNREFIQRSPFADHFYARYRLPTKAEERFPRTSLETIRKTILPDYRWSHSDWIAFSQFLRQEGIQVVKQKGVMFARVMLIDDSEKRERGETWGGGYGY